MDASISDSLWRRQTEKGSSYIKSPHFKNESYWDNEDHNTNFITEVKVIET